MSQEQDEEGDDDDDEGDFDPKVSVISRLFFFVVVDLIIDCASPSDVFASFSIFFNVSVVISAVMVVTGSLVS